MKYCRASKVMCLGRKASSNRDASCQVANCADDYVVNEFLSSCISVSNSSYVQFVPVSNCAAF